MTVIAIWKESWCSVAESGAARKSDPQTSHDAAASLDPTHLYGIIADILRMARTGLISHEIAEVAGMSWGTISPRMAPMRRKGLVFPSDRLRTWHGSPGNPPSDRMNTVWQLEALRDVEIPLTGGTVSREEWRKRKKRKKKVQ